MEEIKAYETVDGRKYYEEEEAKEHEIRLRMKKVQKELVKEAIVLFENELIKEKNSSGEDFYYFSENGTSYWEGEEELEDVEEFVEFIVDVALSHGGKTLTLMNRIKEISEKTQ